ncbi:MAG: lipid biosynthesis B12-binding/radical SAM protein [Nitrospirae bacterium]|nr:lipid biosynthesis B12-binding/radical SAM protein [Nitrospirota bacterium]
MISSNTTTSPYPIYPLGVSIIAAALTNAGHYVRQFDILQHEDFLTALGQEIERFNPGLLGISIRNIDNVNLMNEQYYIETVKTIVKKIREVSKNKILLGGAGFSLLPELILNETGADYGIIGEGESSVVKFAADAANGIYPETQIIGPVTRLQGPEIFSAQYEEDLIKFYLQSGNIASVQTKRGCTHKCIYCSYPVLEGSDIRQRDPRSVVDDIELLSDKHKVKYIFFVDSVFNDDGGAYLGVINEMLRRKVTVPWTGFFKPRELNDEIVEMMKQTGLIAVEIGSDAACDTTLRKLGKGFSFQDIMECNDLFVAHGIATSHFFMFGGPGETQETVLEGIENIKKLKKCVAFIFMGIRILPDTHLAHIALKEKVLSADNGMLKPVYYISPAIDRDWMEKTLTEAFAAIRHCVFPPDTFDTSLRMLHKMGYSGTLWDLLLPDKKHPARKHNAAKQ